MIIINKSAAQFSRWKKTHGPFSWLYLLPLKVGIFPAKTQYNYYTREILRFWDPVMQYIRQNGACVVRNMQKINITVSARADLRGLCACVYVVHVEYDRQAFFRHSITNPFWSFVARILFLLLLVLGYWNKCTYSNFFSVYTI